MRHVSGCQVLCHNLCCLIQSTCELGVEATFWGREEAKKETTPTIGMEDPTAAFAWI